MAKTGLIAGAVALLAVIGAGAWYMGQQPGQPAASAATQSAGTAQPANTGTASSGDEQPLVRPGAEWQTASYFGGDAPCTLEVPKTLAMDNPFEPDVRADPAAWGSDTMGWSGNCVNGKADGVGIARMDMATAGANAWYGTTANGQMTVGVLEQKDRGFVVGRFDGRRFIAFDNADDEAGPVNAAIDAVRAYATKLRQLGENDAARYYETTKVEELQALLLGE